jgi:hypothetical protein
MPSSRFLIASNTLGSSAASVTFSNIPATYTDLVLKFSARTNKADVWEQVQLRINGTTTNRSATWIVGNGASASSVAYTNFVGSIPAASATSNTFGSTEIYIPSYLSSTNKPLSTFNVAENNSSTAGNTEIDAIAGLWSNTATITSLEINTGSANSFISGSTFWLYGIKNS